MVVCELASYCLFHSETFGVSLSYKATGDERIGYIWTPGRERERERERERDVNRIIEAERGKHRLKGNVKK